jgi:hypothetical protein
MTLFLFTSPVLHGFPPACGGLGVYIEYGEALFLADAEAKHGRAAGKVVDLLQFDLLPPDRGGELVQRGEFFLVVHIRYT